MSGLDYNENFFDNFNKSEEAFSLLREVTE